MALPVCQLGCKLVNAIESDASSFAQLTFNRTILSHCSSADISLKRRCLLPRMKMRHSNHRICVTQGGRYGSNPGAHCERETFNELTGLP